MIDNAAMMATPAFTVMSERAAENAAESAIPGGFAALLAMIGAAIDTPVPDGPKPEIVRRAGKPGGKTLPVAVTALPLAVNLADHAAADPASHDCSDESPHETPLPAQTMVTLPAALAAAQQTAAPPPVPTPASTDHPDNAPVPARTGDWSRSPALSVASLPQSAVTVQSPLPSGILVPEEPVAQPQPPVLRELPDMPPSGDARPPAPGAGPASPAQAGPGVSATDQPDVPARRTETALPSAPEAAGDLKIAATAPDPVITAENPHPRAAPAPAFAGGHTPATAPHDFAGLVDRITAARTAAAADDVVRATISHRDFGRVSLSFEPGEGPLTVRVASSDPAFTPAVQVAVQAALQTAGSSGDDGRGNEPRPDGTPGQSGHHAPDGDAQTNGSHAHQRPGGPRAPTVSPAPHRTETDRRHGPVSRRDAAIYA